MVRTAHPTLRIFCNLLIIFNAHTEAGKNIYINQYVALHQAEGADSIRVYSFSRTRQVVPGLG